MRILVLHNDGYYDYVEPQCLDHLIKTEEIISFCRNRGPVILGTDSVLSSQKKPYVGSERRIDM